VSDADTAVEEAIRQTINQARPRDAVHGEEMPDTGHGPRRWVIDPIDGTHNAVMGIPFYSVSLAVGRDSLEGVRHALLMDLVSGDVISASKGRGAFLNGRPIATRRCGRHPASLIYLGRHADPASFERVSRCKRVRAMGCASLEMALVAKGQFDAYYYNSRMPEARIRVIDIAASVLILREAGGEAVDLDGRRLDMPFDLSTRSNFLAYGDQAAREVML